MKRAGVILSFLVVLILLISFILATSPKIVLNEKGLLQAILNKLTEIFEKLKILAEKNTNVSVNVNPNIILPDKECKWEKYNFEYNIGLGRFDEPTNSIYYTSILQIPPNIPYENVKVLGGQVSVYGGQNYNCALLINTVQCWSGKENSLIELPRDCIDAFREGSNNISLHVPASTAGMLYKAWIETEIKPANC